MTRNEFYENINQLGACIYFDILGEEYTVAYTPVYRLETETFGFDEICICASKILNDFELDYECDIEDYDPFIPFARFKTIDEMLNNYLIEGVPLRELLDKVKNMHGIPCGN